MTKFLVSAAALQHPDNLAEGDNGQHNILYSLFVLVFFQLDDEAIGIIGRSCSELVTLNIYGCKVHTHSYDATEIV